MVGARYCSRPSVVSGTREAAAANISSGTAVTTPDSASRPACPAPCSPKVPVPVTPSTATKTAATGKSTAVSIASPSTAPTPAVFFSRP